MKIVHSGVASLVLACLCIGFDGSSAAVTAAEPGMESLAQRGRSAVRRSTGATRTYRSYSIEPDTGGGAPAVMAPPAAERSSGYGGTRSSGSKPSYMRGDSKARGRYHQ